MFWKRKDVLRILNISTYENNKILRDSKLNLTTNLAMTPMNDYYKKERNGKKERKNKIENVFAEK